jgi:hypothetical protein
MSHANNNSNTDDDTSMYSQTICENDTILMVYGALGSDYEEAREFVADMFADMGIDLFEQYEQTTTDAELVINFEETIDDGVSEYERSFSETISPFSTHDKDALRRRFENADLPDEFELRVTEETERCYEHNVRDPIRERVEEMIPVETIEAYDFEQESYSIGIRDFKREIPDRSIDSGPDETLTQACRISGPSSSDIKVRDVLLHKEDRSQHKSFASEQRWSFPVTVHLEAESDEEINNLAQGVIPKLRMQLAALSHVDCVRLKKCNKSVDKEGSCHQL